MQFCSSEEFSLLPLSLTNKYLEGEEQLCVIGTHTPSIRTLCPQLHGSERDLILPFESSGISFP